MNRATCSELGFLLKLSMLWVAFFMLFFLQQNDIYLSLVISDDWRSLARRPLFG